jgi:hypothetical protein
LTRLACFSDVKSHPFFEGIDWELLGQKQIIPPFKPKISGPMDLRNFDKNFTDEKAAESIDVSHTNSGHLQHYKGFTYKQEI